MIVPRSSAKPHHELHSVQFDSSRPAMSGCCVWAQFNFSPLYHFHLFNWAELGWAQLKLSWAGPTRSDCYSAAASADIFCLKSSFFSTVQLSSILIIQLSSVELGWPHKVWLRSADQLISSFFNSIFFNSAQLKSSFPAQLSWSWFQLKLNSAGPTRSDCGVLISSRHTPVSQPRLSFSPHDHSSQFHAVWDKNEDMVNFWIYFSRHKWDYLYVKWKSHPIAIVLFVSRFESSVIQCFHQVPQCNPLPSQCSYALIFRSGVKKRLRRWSSTQSAAFLKPVPPPDCLLDTKYADLLLTLCSISS